MIRLFRVSFPPSLIGLFIVEAALAAGSYLIAHQVLSDEDWALWLFYEGGAYRVGLATASLLLGIHFNGLYSEVRISSRVLLVQKFCLVYGIAFMVQALLSYVGRGLILGRWQMIIGSTIGLAVLPMWRIIFDALLLRMLPSRRVLFVGACDLVRSVCSGMKATPQFRMRSIGYLANQPLTEASPGLGPHLGAPLQLKEVAERDKPELIVIGQTERRKQLPVYDLLELRMTGVAVEEVTSLYEEIMRRVPVRAITPSLMLFASEFGPNPRSLAFQRAYSFVFGLIGAVVALPLMILAGVLIRLTTRGPVFLTQSRMGLNGQVFQLYEFRCAYAETGEAADGGARGESIGLTPVGRWLRRLKLDQLPQLINVLKGEMALVGPRAERPEFSRLLAERIPLYSLRHHLLPGLTGWAQLNHQQMGTFEDVIAALEYDLYYLKNVSLALDFYVIFNTLRFILRGEPDGLGLGRPQADR